MLDNGTEIVNRTLEKEDSIANSLHSARKELIQYEYHGQRLRLKTQKPSLLTIHQTNGLKLLEMPVTVEVDIDLSSCGKKTNSPNDIQPTRRVAKSVLYMSDTGSRGKDGVYVVPIGCLKD